MNIELISKKLDVISEIHLSYINGKNEWWDKTTTRGSLDIDKDWLSRGGYGVLQGLRIQKLIETRGRETCETPYRGEAVPSTCVRLDPWEIKAFPQVDIQKGPTSNEHLPDESRIVRSCYVCDASGSVTCDRCKGSCKVRCPVCSGTGQERKTREVPEIVLCDNCRGSGNWANDGRYILCRSCNGSGRKQKTRKEEYFVPCGPCRTTGLVTCSNCDGTGKVQCHKCCGRRELLEFIRYTQSIKLTVSSTSVVGTITASERLHWGALESFVNEPSAVDALRRTMSDLPSCFDESCCLKTRVAIREKSSPDFEGLKLDTETADELARLHKNTTLSDRHLVHECTVLSQEMGYLFHVTSEKEHLVAVATKNPATILTFGGKGIEARIERQSRFLKFLVMVGCDKMIAATSKFADPSIKISLFVKWFNPILQLFKPIMVVFAVLIAVADNDAIFLLLVLGLGIYNYQKWSAIKKWGAILPNGIHIPGRQKNGNPISYSNRRRFYVYFKIEASSNKGFLNTLLDVLDSALPDGHWARGVKKEERFSKLTGVSAKWLLIGGLWKFIYSLIYRDWALAGPFSNEENAKQWRPWMATPDTESIDEWFSKMTKVMSRPAGEHTCVYIETTH
jgi:hypothetical protein